jgi:hypothetical protein
MAALGHVLTGIVLPKGMVAPTGHTDSALLIRVYRLLQTYATLGFRAKRNGA